MDFVGFIRIVKNVKNHERKFARFSWLEKKAYVTMFNNQLMIMREDGMLHLWTISQEDLVADDWVEFVPSPVKEAV